MEIEILRDPNDESIFTTKIGNSISIQTTFTTNDLNRHSHTRTTDDSLVSEWVRQVKKIYCKKKKKQTLAVGFSAERSDNYACGTNSFGWSYYSRSTPKDKTPPPELLQFCVGNHCLIYEPVYDILIPKVLRDLLSDNNTIVFGVGIHDAAKKLEEVSGLKISRPWDLGQLSDCYKGFRVIKGADDLASYNKNSKGGRYEKYSLVKLAKVVLGPEWNVVKPASIKWYESDTSHNLSDEKVKYGTVDAFLAYEMGMTFLDIYHL